MKILAPLESFCRAASGGTRRASVRVGPDCPPGVVRAADALSEDFGRVLGDFPGPADLEVHVRRDGERDDTIEISLAGGPGTIDALRPDRLGERKERDQSEQQVSKTHGWSSDHHHLTA